MSERWIAIDWGTSNLRAWLMDGTTAEAQAASGDGMGSLTPDAFEPALLKLAKPWLAEHGRLDAVACGMVGARQGWREAPYVSVPSPPLDPARFVHAPCSDARLTVTIVHGMSQDDPSEIMRGEETQLAGLLALDPGFDGMACLPGTHSKWARLAGGRMRGFATFMTGELFSLLDRQSVLRHVTGDGRDDTAFAGGVTDGLADPASLVSSLFGIRAAALVAGLKPASANACRACSSAPRSPLPAPASAPASSPSSAPTRWRIATCAHWKSRASAPRRATGRNSFWPASLPPGAP